MLVFILVSGILLRDLAQDCSELDVKKDHDHDLLLEAWHRSHESVLSAVCSVDFKKQTLYQPFVTG